MRDPSRMPENGDRSSHAIRVFARGHDVEDRNAVAALAREVT
jgi:hypothetical protein